MSSATDPSRDGDGAPEPVSSDRLWLEVSLLSATSDNTEPPPDAPRRPPNPTLPTVLVLAQEADLRAYIRHCLDGADLRVLEADRPGAGSSPASEITPDLLILDETAAAFERTDAYPALAHVPRILVIDEMPDVRTESIDQRPVVARVVKPFNARRLRAEVDRCLALARSVPLAESPEVP